ncbi:tripartite tricarboxylate transporter TctB family protein [Pseudoruegeria sp. HB172150]|uniref:tripartite tricarboxylate transporter TctB family protein n=1 Tax=Pseudoruegeria sp. HB172150 TaxID=2721164 RepID=UPI001556788C|nr:tripartite tricarboxylate transporter TctB family protein [Pseudoruegeria sp. HB172150]
MRFDTPAADRVTAAALFALGAAMSWGGFVMDRLEIRQIHPASIPGLVPMILGAAMMLCALLLALSTRGQTAPDTAPQGNWSDFAFAGVWSCVFALLLVGTLPFAAAAAIYTFVFAGWFTWQPAEGPARNAKQLIFIAVFAIAVAAGIAALFRYGFLVRLP